MFVKRLSKEIFKFANELTKKMHSKCVGGAYPRTDGQVIRSFVPFEKISWKVTYDEYAPVEYTSPFILSKPSFADENVENLNAEWNEVDGKIDRRSFIKKYEIFSNVPRNPIGRTGLIGRGCLGRWGPNHAADPVVTRWAINSDDGQFLINDLSQKRILEFVAIQRRDCGEWALPGGMVDPGERVTTTVQREFMEEALNSNEMSDDQKLENVERLNNLFSKGTEVYSGYVDDPRNTDNAWMETVAFNFHEGETEDVLYDLKLTAGDDEKSVRWMRIDGKLNLYASHRSILEKVAKIHEAHW